MICQACRGAREMYGFSPEELEDIIRDLYAKSMPASITTDNPTGLDFPPLISPQRENNGQSYSVAIACATCGGKGEIAERAPFDALARQAWSRRAEMLLLVDRLLGTGEIPLESHRVFENAKAFEAASFENAKAFEAASSSPQGDARAVLLEREKLAREWILSHVNAEYGPAGGGHITAELHLHWCGHRERGFDASTLPESIATSSVSANWLGFHFSVCRRVRSESLDLTLTVAAIDLPYELAWLTPRQAPLLVLPASSSGTSPCPRCGSPSPSMIFHRRWECIDHGL